jgi:CheY-like chemotaxis protein
LVTTKLLAVDDSKTMRKVLEITFAGNTYDSTVVGSADEALSAIRASPPQIAVVDGHLGGSSGYDLCKQIKDVAPGVVVVLLSSKQRPYDTAAGSAAGVDDHFDKPFDSTKFLDKLGSLDLSAPPLAAAQPAAAPAPVVPAVQRPMAPQTNANVEPPRVTRPSATPRPTISRSAVGAAAPMQSVQKPAPRPQAPAAAPSPVRPAASAAVQVPQLASTETAASTAVDGMSKKLESLGLTKEQMQGVLALSREVVEQVVWEVVPTLAETLIKEEIARLTAE